MSLRVGGAIILVVALIFGGYYGVPYVSADKVPWQTTTTYMRNQIYACIKSDNGSWRNSCFNALSSRLADQFSTEEILRTLASIDQEEGIKQTCHSLVHMIGQKAYQSTRDVPGTFAKCRSAIACGEGCFHGTIEAYVQENGSPQDAEAVASLCDRATTGNEVNYDACVHGVGHAAMLSHDYDGKRSLEACDIFPESKDRNQCYAGVFMEEVFMLHREPAYAIESSNGSCAEIPESYQNECYAAHASYVLQYRPGGTQDGFVEAAAFCATIPQKFAASCYGTLGGEAIVIFPDVRPIGKVCDRAPEGSAREECYDQAIIFTGHAFAGDAEKMRDVCRFANPADSSLCYGVLGERITEWHLDTSEQLCTEYSSASEAEKESCKKGASTRRSQIETAASKT